jgi:hypothetical protein
MTVGDTVTRRKISDISTKSGRDCARSECAMSSKKATEIKEALQKLVQLGNGMQRDLLSRVPGTDKEAAEKERKLSNEKNISFEGRYQSWYTEAFRAIKQLLPERLAEFAGYYQIDPKRKAVNALTFVIQDWLLGVRPAANYLGEKQFDELAAILGRLHSQIEILASANARFDSLLFDIRQLVQADLFDSEIDAGRELLRAGFLRAAGVVAGVVLEKHLSEVCESHNIQTRKKNPTISDFNDALKAGDVVDVPTWRFIQRLGDLRNLSGHSKDREPTSDEAAELLDGVAKIVKSVF